MPMYYMDQHIMAKLYTFSHIKQHNVNPEQALVNILHAHITALHWLVSGRSEVSPMCS